VTRFFVLALVAGFAQAGAQTPEETREDVLALTAPGTLGRAVGSEGAAKARQHLVSGLLALSARPLPGQAELGIPFEFVSGVEDEGSTLLIGERRFGPDQVRALAFSATGEARGDFVFAGYGIRLPDTAEIRYDSYAELEGNVEGKIVVALRYFPDDVTDEARAALNRGASLRAKAAVARELGAAGLLILTGPRSENAGELLTGSFDIAAPGSQGIVVASVSGAVGEALFEGSGQTVAEAQETLDRGDALSFPLPGEGVFDARLRRDRSFGVNVAGLLPDAFGSLAPPWVVVGAHYDHLGMGGAGSLAPDGPPAEHPGADDNASGVAAVLALARQVAANPLDRPLLAAFWSGEEMGLLGSNAFVREVMESGQVAAYINLDMVGRMRENRLVVQAMGSSPVWPGVVERANVPVGFDLALSDDPYLPTDSSAFNSAGVPTLNLFTGTHEDYHRPSDTADRLNYEDLARVSRFATLVARRVAAADSAPEFVRVERSAEDTPARASMRAYTGTIPEYATEVEGLLLGGVMAGGPAEEAGLRKGDVIVAFGAVDVLNIYDYMNALEAARIGEPIRVVVIRDGERLEFTLTPAARP